MSKLVDSKDNKIQVNLSVRSLVEFLLRSGDIDDEAGGVDPMDAMQQGSRIHRKLQSKGGSLYHPEVPLSIAIEYDDFVLGLEGRADGIIYDVDEEGNPVDVTIDEIKGVFADVNLIEVPVAVHAAQAKCYAYIFALENNLPFITVQMTYCNLETEVVNRLRDEYTFAEIEKWFLNLIGQYEKWARFQVDHKKSMLNSVESLDFPFEYRPGQKQLVADVYRSISREKTLFIQAPTGTGKTISTVYPAIQAVGQKMASKIFYLTAKTATSLVAIDTFKLLAGRGYQGNAIALTAKDKACLLDERSCNPRSCPYAAGHFDRINDAIYDLITHETIITRDNVIDYANAHKVCPFELSLDVSLWCDNIICDYNYVFDPNVYLKRFFAEGRKGEYIFLIDEAHNMVDRAREMYSEDIVKEELLYVKKEVAKVSKKLANYIDKVNKIMLEYKRACTGEMLVLQEIDRLIMAVYNVQFTFEELFSKRVKFDGDKDAILDFYFRVRNFSTLSQCLNDDNYRIYCDYDEENRFRLHLFCVDPSASLEERLKRARSTVYFSATLLPVNYYKELLTTEKDVYAIYANSVFDSKNRALMIAKDVTSRYTRRGEEEYLKFAQYVEKVVSAKQGNYMVFAPSYIFMETVAEKFARLAGNDVEIAVQKSGMTESEREEFLQAFEEQRGRSFVAFCTLGGIFSEGIDLVNEKLIGVIVIGAGLPQIGNDRKIMQNFFDGQGKNGFEYAYLYPGMNKVIQAAGRLIRTSKDVGIIALLDERFQNSSYQKAFPREWEDAKTVDIDSVSLNLTNFWSQIQ